MTAMPPSSIWQTSLAAGALAISWAGGAAAQSTAATPPSAPSFAFGAGASTDYVFRGVSRSDDRGQGFASVDGAYADGYAGVWVSSVAIAGAGPAHTGAEIDAYGGWRPEFRGYSLDFGVQYDSFTGQPAGGALDYGELYAKVSRAIGPVTGRVGLHYAPAFGDHGGQAVYAEAGADYALARDWSASAAIGYQTVEHPNLLAGGDYLTWNAGFTHTFGDHLAVDLRYSDTDRHGLGPTYEGRLVGQIRASF